MPIRPILTAALPLAFVLLAAAAEPATNKAEIADTSFIRKAPAGVDAGVVIIPAADDRNIDGDVKAFKAALKLENPKYAAGLGLNIVSAGPQLDSPDEAKVDRVAQTGNDISITISYTSATTRGVQLLRNVPWTPLAFILPPKAPNAPGVYTITLTWQCSDLAAPGTEKPANIVQTTKYEITAK